MSTKSEWNANFRISLLLQEANMLAVCYKKYLVEATTEEMHQHTRDPEKARLISYLLNLMANG